jgi:hypothetical protein
MIEDRQLALRRTMADLVAVYEVECANLRTAYAMLAASENVLRATFSTYTRVLEGYGDSEKSVDRVIEHITKDAWNVVLEKMELRKLASVARWEQVSKEVDDGKMPPLTLANVYNLVLAYVANADTIAQEAYLEVFGILTPGRRENGQRYKTNSRYGIGAVAILSGFVEDNWNGGFRISHYRRTDLVQVDRVFHALDGQSVLGGYTSPVCDAVESTKDGEGETPYFKFRACANGNLHLRFKRPDLVAALNAVAGDGRSLRGG